jgi:hypothetical protein
MIENGHNSRRVSASLITVEECQNSIRCETPRELTHLDTVWLGVPKPACRRVSDLRWEAKVCHPIVRVQGRMELGSIFSDLRTLDPLRRRC